MTELEETEHVVLECRDLHKCYKDGEQTIHVLNNLNVTIKAGEKVAIIGPSGSGKSTLLHLLGGLDDASQGTVLLQGQRYDQMTESKRCKVRNEQLGFVYQFHHLLAEFSALENVMMPLLINRGLSVNLAQKKAQERLGDVGLSHRLSHKPSQLSGGERQRVAIARAMVMQPTCILADEPTGNLDSATAQSVFELLLSLNKEVNTALIIVTHDLMLAGQMDRRLSLKEGRLQS